MVGACVLGLCMEFCLFASVHDLILVVDHWQGSDDQFAVLILDKSVAE